MIFQDDGANGVMHDGMGPLFHGPFLEEGIASAVGAGRDMPQSFAATDGPAGGLATGPDLQILNTNLDTQNWVFGQPISLDWDVFNLGNADAAESRSAVFLSDDSTITIDDTVVAVDPGNGVLVPGAGKGWQWTPDPANLGVSGGTYHVGVIADVFGDVAELDEANNLGQVFEVFISENAPPPPDDFVDDSSTSGAVVPGGDATGVIEVDGDRDWFAVELEAGTTYVLEQRGAGGGGAAGASGAEPVAPVRSDDPDPVAIDYDAVDLDQTGELMVTFAAGYAADFAPRTDLGAMGLAGQAATSLSGAAFGEVVRTEGGPLGRSGTVQVVDLPDGADIAASAAALAALPEIEAVDPNAIATTFATSDDPRFTNGDLWGAYGDTTTPANQFGSQAAEVWAGGNTGDMSVVIGIVDDGYDPTHEDLYLNTWLNQEEIPGAIAAALTDTDSDGLITFRDLNDPANAAYVTDSNANGRIDAIDLLNDSSWADGSDTDNNGFVDDLYGWDARDDDNNPFETGDVNNDGIFDSDHGTHVAGTVGAIGGNATGVAGVNWNVQLLPVRFMQEQSNGSASGSYSDAVEALDYFTLEAQNSPGQHFIATNNSWGGPAYSSVLEQAIIDAALHDIVTVAAAGNDNKDNDADPSYPANMETTAGAGYDAVVSVASMTSGGGRSGFSNYGATTVDIGAPGSGIWSTIPGGGYSSYNGTSMATPHVSGALGLAAAADPGASAEELVFALFQSAAPTPTMTGITATDGRLDAEALVRQIDDEFFGTLGDPVLRLYDAGGSLVASDDNGGDGPDSRIEFTPSTSGTYYLGAGSAGDTGIGSYTVSVEDVGQPDMTGRTIDAVIDPAVRGDSMIVTFSVDNLGTAASGAFDVEYRLSRDGVIDASDLLLGTASFTSIAPGASDLRETVIGLPGNDDMFWDADTEYAIGAIIDPADVVAEIDETNNANVGEGTDIDTVTITPVPEPDAIHPDFDGSGTTDLLFRNAAGGNEVIWYLGAPGTVENRFFFNPANFDVVEMADFDGSGTTDLLIENTVGNKEIWYLGAQNTVDSRFFFNPAGWSVETSGDFDGSGTDDLLLRNDAVGNEVIWFMDETGAVSNRFFFDPVGWDVDATGDFDGSGTDDLLLRNEAGGDEVIWFMDQTGAVSDRFFFDPVGWDVDATGDFDGSGTDDLLLRNEAGGNEVIWFMDQTGAVSDRFFFDPPGWDVDASGDFDGNGTDDLLLRNTTGGNEVIWFMDQTGAVSDRFFFDPAGWDVAETGDFDGSGTEDLLLGNATSGASVAWYMTEAGSVGDRFFFNASGWDLVEA